MKFRVILASASLIVAFAMSMDNVKAQDVHFTQFDASPLILNPAFTGGFNGDYRAQVVYRDQWRSFLGDKAFKTYAASFDLPIIRDISIDDYLAMGVQFYNDRAGDGNLNNFSASLSVAYHKFLGSSGRSALTVGLQGGYANKNIDLSKLYFADEFRGGRWNPGTSDDFGHLGNGLDAYFVNAGISFSQAIGDRSGFIIGGGVNNINQPKESFSLDNRRSDVGLAIRYTAQLGGIIGAGDRLSVRPAVLFQTQAGTNELVGGTELNFKLGEDPDAPDAPAIFAGAWYRHLDAVMVTAGVEFKGFRVGFAYDVNTSGLRAGTNGNGGMEIMVRYIAPSPISWARELLYPCGRF